MKKIILLIGVLLLLSGCGNTIEGWEYKRAKEICDAHGGVDSIFIVLDLTPLVTCRDGFSSLY